MTSDTSRWFELFKMFGRAPTPDSYAAVFPMGYEARSNVPGLVPMRAYDLWRPALDNCHVPGMVPRIQTVPDAQDLAALAKDIAAAKQQADLVCASFQPRFQDGLSSYSDLG